jgi:probable phosphoglycerate mutase
LLLVRHGESEPLVPGRPFPLVDGHGDPALAPEGEAQAERVGERLARLPIDAIYVTTLRRTHQTAAPLARRLGVTPLVEPDLREVHLGKWEGELYRQRMAEGHPIALQMIREQRWDAIPGAEPAEALRRRVRGAVERIVATHPDSRVVVFSHGGVIGEIIAQAVATPHPFAFLGCNNASITHLVVAGSRWIVRRFNDTAHLDDDLDLDPEPAPLES